MIYLASPYSHPELAVRRKRFEDACDAAGRLIREGRIVFSPIAHTHPIAERNVLPLGWDFWHGFDRAFIERADALYVLMLDGWDQSKGVAGEIEIARECGKPTHFLCPKTWIVSLRIQGHSP